MTQEQANWEWMDARVKKLESYIEAYKENRTKQADRIAELEKKLDKYHKQGQSIPCKYTEGM